MKKEILLMTTGIFVGTLLCHGGGAAAAGTVAEPSWQPIFVNGEQVQMEAYNIHGNNFVKLRDIGQAVGFNVFWKDGVQVDSDAPYTGEAPQQEVPKESVLNTEDVCQEIIDLTNDLRREHGLPIFATDNKLMETAQVRAEEMVATTTACHTRARMAGGIVPPQTVRTQQRTFTALPPAI